jgi:hypothetical protein
MGSVRGRTAIRVTSIPMQIKHSRLKLRAILEDVRWRARWRAHDTAVAVEEDFVWKSADAVRDLAERTAESPVGRGAGRLRSLLDRRLIWPLTDRLSEQGDLARTVIGTAAVAMAAAAAWGGATLASGGESPTSDPAAIVAVTSTASGDTLEGVSPSFTSAQAGPGPKPVPAEERPGDPIGRTAWDFAQAFVLYEVGKAEDAADDSCTASCSSRSSAVLNSVTSVSVPTRRTTSPSEPTTGRALSANHR